MSKYAEENQYENYLKRKEGGIEILFDKLEKKIDDILNIIKINKCCLCKCSNKTKALSRDEISFEGED